MNAIQCYEGDGIAPPHSLSLAEAKELRKNDLLHHAVSREATFTVVDVEDVYDKRGRVTKVILQVWPNRHGPDMPTEPGLLLYTVPHDSWLCKAPPL